MSITHAGRIELMIFMRESLNISDFEELCLRLGVDHEDLSGSERQAKIRELIAYTKRYSRLCDLVAKLAEMRPSSVPDLNKIATLLNCALIKTVSDESKRAGSTQNSSLGSQGENIQEPSQSPPVTSETIQTALTSTSQLEILNRTEELLPSTANSILQAIFTRHSQVTIRAEFGSGLSGSRVFLVRPIGQDSLAELLTVVKIDRVAAIRREWQAYQTCIEDRLPDVAEIRGTPIFLPDGEWGGLRYPLAGGAFEVQSFHDYYQEATPEDIKYVLAERLSRSLGTLWKQSQPGLDFHVGTHYDSFLPMNLVIDCRGVSSETVVTPTSLTPHNALFNTLKTGASVQLSGFRIARVIVEESRLSLDMPGNYTAYRMAVHVDSVAGYEEGQILSGRLTGVVTKMRHELLQEQAQEVVEGEVNLTAVTLQTAKNQFLTNPLQTLPKILRQTFDVKMSCLHGDLNLQNILVEPQSRTVSLIDFAKSGRNHVLRDLICLEMNIVVRLMPAALNEANLTPEDIVGFYETLHCVMKRPSYPFTLPYSLQKPFAALQSLRHQAQAYLFTAGKWDEYYIGLMIYFLGALKFKDLDSLPTAPWPKRLAFYGAAAAQKLLDEGEKVCEETAVATSPTATPTTSTTPLSPIRRSSTNTFLNYERGLQNLLDQLGANHDRYGDALLFQQRLTENIQRSRRHGDTANRRAERSEVIDELNALALETLQKSFNDLCQ